MKTFRGFKNAFSINGNSEDRYYATLPEHDLGALSNYFFRISSKRDIKVCLDIGANIGLSALLLSEIAPTAHIYAFEPSERTYGYLLENVRNGFSDNFISAHRAAVGKAEGVVRFADDQHVSSGNHIALDGAGVEVALTTVDAFVSRAGLASVDFVKIDVEGFETDVLEGALETIFRFRPVFFMEFNEYALRNNSAIDPERCLQRWLECLGPLGIVDPLTGATTPLPPSAERALADIRQRTKTEFDVFDLVTQGA